MNLITLAIAIFSGFVTLLVLGWEIHRLRQSRPTSWVETPAQRFGIRWHTETQTWTGLEQALLAIEHVLIRRYGAGVVKKKRLLDFWVDVYPRNSALRTASNPTGKIGGRSINGAIERLNLFFGLRPQHVILVMQHHKLKTKMPNGETWQEGDLLEAGSSALFHEVAEHYVPLMLKGDINARHAEEWKLLTTEMRQAYKLLGASEAAS